MSEGWIELCGVDEVPLEGARVIERGAGLAGVALFRCSDGSVFAVEDRCPHRGGPLSQGIVYGHRVACPLHNWSVELASGEAVAPDQGGTRTFSTRVTQGRIWIEARALAVAGAAPAPKPCPGHPRTQDLPSPAADGRGVGGGGHGR